MTLTIEDGTGIDGADSFATVAEYEAFVLDYFGDTVTGDEPALRRAFVILSTQPWGVDLWPTFGGTIPAAVKKAQAAIARVEAANPGTLSPVYDRSQAKVLTAVGSIQWTPKAGPDTIEAARPAVTMAMDFLKAADLLQSGGAVGWLERG